MAAAAALRARIARSVVQPYEGPRHDTSQQAPPPRAQPGPGSRQHRSIVADTPGPVELAAGAVAQRYLLREATR